MDLQEHPTTAKETSVFESDLPLENKLDRARTDLLDLSARNRLLHVPRSAKNARIIEVIDERSEEIFRLLVGESKTFTFLAGKDNSTTPSESSEEPDEIAELAQPEDDSIDERGVLNRHADTKLQTRLTSKGLQKRLLELYLDANTLEQEQGVNILFLALGMLRWVDPKNAENIRYAPLVLVPVALERGSAAERFKLKCRPEEFASNLSLETYLERVHNLKLPAFEGGDDFNLSAYMAAVAEVIALKPDWSVVPNDVVLGFFSFAKFLMYRDLDPECWPEDRKITAQPLVRGLLSEGFPQAESLLADHASEEDTSVDNLIPLSEMLHIVDCDSSQALAVQDVRRGGNLVIQGPPGTGKSQTIANIIASAVADGKTVLFVAEKMAALDVVKRRLDQAGVGDACLELHSNKANKRELLEELRRTWELGSPLGTIDDALDSSFTSARDQLNSYVNLLHQPLVPSGFTAYQVIGEIVRLRHAGQTPVEFRLLDAPTWDPQQRRERAELLEELSQRIAVIGVPAQHVWRGIGIEQILPHDVERLTARLVKLRENLSGLLDRYTEFAPTLLMEVPQSLHGMISVEETANSIATSPAVDAAARLLSAQTDETPKPSWLSTFFTQKSELQQSVTTLSQLLKLSVEESARKSLQQLVAMATHAASLPAYAASLANPAWDNGTERAARLATAASTLEGARAAIGSQLSEAVWSADLNNARQVLASQGSSLFRFLNGQWRAANRLVQSYLTTGKSPLEEVLRLLDALSKGQAARTVLQQEDTFGRESFGAAWRGTDTPAKPLHALVDWMHSIAPLASEDREHLRSLAATLNPPESLQGPLQELLRKAAEMQRLPLHLIEPFAAQRVLLTTELEQTCQELKLDLTEAFGVTTLPELALDILVERLALWAARSEQLSNWIAYRSRSERARTLGLGDLVSRAYNGALIPAQIVPVFEMAYFEALLSSMAQEHPELGRFDGHLHTRLVESFTAIDKQRIQSAALQVARIHHRRIPQGSGGVGPLGVLRGEMARRRGHMPIRKLMQNAGPAVQALKPVMMMSPLSVAQFLSPGEMTFDLLVMDEASQIQPVDALGAIARCRQVVVVGDERQLPPTKFFAKVTGDASDDDDDTAQVSDIESVLGLFSARGLPQRMLRWHYRSRHQSLIAVSNSQFYENKLLIVPSPYTATAGTGLRFHHLPNGVFDSGGTGANAIEARAVAEAVIRHALEHPQESLGVATFSVRQRRSIQDELEALRRLNPQAESFFTSHPTEPFFLKNLENVQGDERDVIFISVGYGRNAAGVFAMRFGPLGNDGGERRLNVLISRAKRSCEVFSSITDQDINLERARGRGVFAFKLFLHFARTGHLDMGRATSVDTVQMLFEREVKTALTLHPSFQQGGYQVHEKIGISGLVIDLAIAHPEVPGRYLLGIECDGPSYRRGRWARDRDRISQQVLADHGWILHRLWSPDWLHRPVEQLERVLAAIDHAKAQIVEGTQEALAANASTRAVPMQLQTIERESVVEISLEPASSVSTSHLYIEASPVCPSPPIELHLTPMKLLSEMVKQIVAVEGPVHTDEVTARIRTAWGLQRTGPRIQAAVERAIALALREGQVLAEGSFLSSPACVPRPRDRSHTTSPGLRRPEMICVSEIDAAVLQVIHSNLGARPEELEHSVARLFGFRATSMQMRETIQASVQRLLAQDVLQLHSGLLVLPAAS
ncbi:DUF3320 domain-containing protein [Granulicella mallensis]|uniref:Uncharacterized protein n=1 Tax=Granulicella mallensis (strain ATCC BAA-1857 / DSM 23137 / MP5ACTX8) TaxID=682795 RepID=G8NZA5_GRAMM|nr:DUF3320 domain-containing protein [Granulicella mallensis]AEU36841.1 Protein of unknown function DUF3320 [Granulicella mallensis MP5ACTX8]